MSHFGLFGAASNPATQAYVAETTARQDRTQAMANLAGTKPDWLRDKKVNILVQFTLERLPSLLLDVDTGADLAALRKRLAPGGARAARTRAVLSEDERHDMLSITAPA